MLLQVAAMAAAAVAQPGVCAPQQLSGPSTFSEEVRRARGSLSAVGGSAGSTKRQFLAPDVLMMPEFQVTLRGPDQVAAYDRAMQDRYGAIGISARQAADRCTYFGAPNQLAQV